MKVAENSLLTFDFLAVYGMFVYHHVHIKTYFKTLEEMAISAIKKTR